MWQRLRWQYSQWKLLYFPVSPFIHWLFRGIFEEWLFSYLLEYAKTRGGWMMGIIQWAEIHPFLSTSVVTVMIGLVVAGLAIKDAKKRLQRIYELEGILLQMFNIALDLARAKAQTITLDKQWDEIMKQIAKDIVGVDAKEYSGKDMTDRKEIAKIEKEVRNLTPTDEDTVPIYKLLASAMVNNGYGIDEKNYEENRQYKKLKRRLEALRKVPSNLINNAINKCLDYVYILSNIYIYHVARMRNIVGIGQMTLAEMRNFIRDQDNNTGDISKCLTELRIEIDDFVKGEKGGK